MSIINAKAPSAAAPTSVERKELGAVYTPEFLAEWVAKTVLDFTQTERPVVVDLGCGDGALLSAVNALNAAAHLIGVELSARALRAAEQNLPSHSQLIGGDVLRPARGRVGLADTWRKRFGVELNAVIMNPPWGAEHGIGRDEAASAGLSLAKGQFDTYDLFCELALQLLPEDGAFGFILPDSILLPEHKSLRDLLLQHRIDVLARVGEGIFPSVFRGCVVVIGRVGQAPAGHAVECLRLTKEHRNAIRDGATMGDLKAALAHRVSQDRFANDPKHRFDLDVSEADTTMSKVKADDRWTDHLISRRGAEISKTGHILACPSCGSVRPLPRGETAECKDCGTPLNRSAVQSIVASKRGKQGVWEQFIVGEDVSRYAAAPSRWIRCDVPGINYKAKTPKGVDRILVRKTGIGLDASIDSSGAYTNQVVFEYVTRDPEEFPFSYLHYVLGVLSSRVLFAYHLKRSGELEWRSHPYMTQKTLADLPIPVPSRLSPSWAQAAAIAKTVEQHLKTGDQDLKIEALVAGLYDLTPNDLTWTLDVIDQAADLQAMKRLRLPSGHGLAPVKVLG